jgi:hypothetical protein
MNKGRVLPIADTPQLRRAARRTTLVRRALTGALAMLVGAAVVLAPRGAGQDSAVAGTEAGETIEIVLDVSGSVSEPSLGKVARTLGALSRGGNPVGLVLFSDSAQEALPPGSPPAALEPFARIFSPGRSPDQQALAPLRYERNPWYPSFSGGTRMSVGLATAAEALRRDRARGRILLLSDLGDAPDDRPSLRRELVAIAKAGIDVQAVVLPNAGPADRRWFEQLEGHEAVLPGLPRRSATRAPAATGSAAFPVALAAIGAVLASVLAANELLARSLRWGRQS